MWLARIMKGRDDSKHPPQEAESPILLEDFKNEKCLNYIFHFLMCITFLSKFVFSFHDKYFFVNETIK